MMYFDGCPSFSLEKPILTPFYPNILKEKQKSSDWIGELKLKSKRGVITTNQNNDVHFLLYGVKNISNVKGNALQILKELQLAPNSVFDACILDYVDSTRFWIFDCLVYNSTMLYDIPLLQRKNFLHSIITSDLIWKPITTNFWLQEINLIKKQDSNMVKEQALQCGVPYADFKKIVTGMLIKNKQAYLSYPEKTKFVASSMFKINIS